MIRLKSDVRVYLANYSRHGIKSFLLEHGKGAGLVNEILAEKTRAIYERQGRARDIYDVVNINRSFREHVDINVARIGLIKKFEPLLTLIPHQKDEVSLPRAHFPTSPIMPAQKMGLGMNIASTFSPHEDQIRYAARNRLCLEIEYQGEMRLIEPYSLTRPKTGNQLLNGYELLKGVVRTNDIRSYRLQEIVRAEVTRQAFLPRYVVDL